MTVTLVRPERVNRVDVHRQVAVTRGRCYLNIAAALDAVGATVADLAKATVSIVDLDEAKAGAPRLRRAEQLGGRVVQRVLVDLVGDDEQVLLFGHGAHRTHQVGRRERAGRVVRRRQHERAGIATRTPRPSDGLPRDRAVARPPRTAPAVARRRGRRIHSVDCPWYRPASSSAAATTAVAVVASRVPW